MGRNIHVEKALDMLKMSPLKITNQRVCLVEILFRNGDSHFTVEEVYRLARKKRHKISLATVYNCLNQFVVNEILKVVKLSCNKFYFDTNLRTHHHFFCKTTGKLQDIPSSDVVIEKLPDIPTKKKFKSVDVIINISD